MAESRKRKFLAHEWSLPIDLADKYMKPSGLSFPDLIGESSFFDMLWIVRSSLTMTTLEAFACRINSAG
jgi:hypothetical protein